MRELEQVWYWPTKDRIVICQGSVDEGSFTSYIFENLDGNEKREKSLSPPRDWNMVLIGNVD